ncbi:MAG: arsenate reductase/protein-tyrosine-phosphatase family protein [Acidimicrobiales bacterium]
MCTANQCRSPMAEGLLRRHLARLGVDADVSSAGFLIEGEPATEDAIATMAGRGVDIAEHSSRVVSREDAADADLIVAMTGQHVAEVTVMEPALFARIFALRDLARRIAEKGPAQRGESIAAWLSRLNAGRTPRDVLNAGASDDVADPIGESPAVYERTADELDALLGQLAAALSHLAPATS